MGRSVSRSGEQTRQPESAGPLRFSTEGITMARKSEVEERPTDRRIDDDVAAIVAEGEAGVDTAMRVLEATETAYYGAVAATTSTPAIATASATWVSRRSRQRRRGQNE